MTKSALQRLSSARLKAAVVFWMVPLALSLQVGAAPIDLKSFDTPEAAAQSLVDALKADDEKALVAILGESLKDWIESGDPVADRNARDDFVSAYDQKHTIEQGEGGQATLLIGDDDFPFSIPLLKTSDRWTFSPELGKQELIDRRVGENELSTVQTLLAIVDAQDEYAASDPEGKGARVDILKPGPGVGGHCIAVDPWFIVSAFGDKARLIREARWINSGRPRQVVRKVLDAVTRTPGGITSIGCFGLSYKPDVDDYRESPAVEVMAFLSKELHLIGLDIDLRVVEPFTKELPRELEDARGARLVTMDEALDADLLLMLVDHRRFREVPPSRLDGKNIIDTRGIWR